MKEKQKPSKAPKAWWGKPERRPVDPHYGEMKPVVYGDNLGKRIGNKLLGMFTGWMR